MKKVMLFILDGIGVSDKDLKNAYKDANTDNLDNLMREYPNTLLDASGKFVGLPDKQMGNSEVGHSNIGAGRVVYQSLEYINKKIEDESFFENEGLKKSIEHAKVNNSNLHLMGLLSDGGIHSHINHLISILDMCKKENFSNVYIHVFTDGRDTKVDSALDYIEILEDYIKKNCFGKIASVSGRFYAMDRDNRYDRVSAFYETVINGNSNNYDKAMDAINESYLLDITDEFIEPVIIDGGRRVVDGDSIILFNFREDRLREIVRVLNDLKFREFPVRRINNLRVTTMMPVSSNKYSYSCFKLDDINNPIGVYLASKGYSQVRIAETEKYAHVTYFFDGGKDYKLRREKKILVPSLKVKTYDMKPEMSCYEITKSLLKVVKKKPDFVVLNFANGDMVGHTGNYKAAIKGVEAIDKCLGIILNKVNLDEYTLVITADHGNCEVMENEDKSINTNHTNNKVFMIVTDNSIKLRDGGKLSNIAPTILDIMGIDKPLEMNEDSLIVK